MNRLLVLKLNTWATCYHVLFHPPRPRETLQISHDAKTGATSVSFLEAVGVGSAEAAQSLLERATKQVGMGWKMVTAGQWEGGGGGGHGRSWPAPGADSSTR